MVFVYFCTMMKKITILGCALSLMLLFSNTFKKKNDAIYLSIIQEGDTIKVVNQKMINLKRAPFQVLYRCPKGSAEMILQSDTIGNFYHLFNQGKKLKKQKPWQLGNAFSVSVAKYGTIDSLFLYSDEGRQPYIYEDSLWNSFHHVDSTQREYLLLKKFQYFMDVELDRNTTAIADSQIDTLYCIAEMSSQNENKKQKEKVLSFILNFKG
jgi:hypothetical protein